MSVSVYRALCITSARRSWSRLVFLIVVCWMYIVNCSGSWTYLWCVDYHCVFEKYHLCPHVSPKYRYNYMIEFVIQNTQYTVQRTQYTILNAQIASGPRKSVKVTPKCLGFALELIISLFKQVLKRQSLKFSHKYSRDLNYVLCIELLNWSMKCVQYAQCTLYNVHSTVYIVQCSMYIV